MHLVQRGLRLGALAAIGLTATASLLACNPPLQPSAQATVRSTHTPTNTDRTTCQRLITSRVIDSGPVSVAKAVGGSVASLRYWLRNRPGPASDVLAGFPGKARATVCVYRGLFPVPVPPGVPEPTGARYVVNPAGKSVMDSAGPIESVLSSTPSQFPPAPRPAGS